MLVPAENGKYREGFIGADLDMKSGHHDLVVKSSPSGNEEVFGIDVVDKDYGVRRLTLPDNMVNLDKESLARVTKESARLKEIWSSPPVEPMWNGSFLKPVDGEIIGTFGRRSVINNQPRSPHTGVDLRGKKGTPVKASNNGKVVLTANHFFTGNTVILDHGGEIKSMYFHLDKILVKIGDTVRRGEVIGLVGSTGRVTGPHLHWGVRVNGARVNPMSLIDISNKLEE